MDFGIKGRVALVAAASRGLGRAVALRLAQEGAAVAICSRDEKRIAAAAAEIAEETGSRVKGYRCDVTDAASVRELVTRVREELGGVAVLVTNAGGPPAGLAADFGPDDYRKSVELNLMSTITLVYEVLPFMKEKKWGRIVAVTSVAARQPIENLILSNTARAGVLGFLKTLSAQVARDGITVNSVCPGYTKTERIEELAQAFVAAGRGSIEDFYGNIETQVPAGRMGTPAEFANVVAFLASAAASYVTGVALPIDGGYVRGLY
jgi:3-oxoacyl-[acyl-carrier protein] reductase